VTPTDLAARPIGVFDSGVGGLTVVRSLLRELPDEAFVYLGDTARLPYGTKSPETVTRFAHQNMSFLLGADVKAVVVACHTASSNSLRALQDREEVPTIGVTEPGSHAAVDRSRTGRIGVIGTRATVASGAFQREIGRRRPDTFVAVRACPLFVPLVEEGWEESDVARQVANEYLAPLLRERIDCLVLGCTHYPVLRPLLQEVTGPEVDLIDPGEETARELVRVLEIGKLRRPAGAPPARHRFVVTDATPRLPELVRTFLGHEINEVETLPIEMLESLERSR